MWGFAATILQWILSKLGTRASEEDLARTLHQHLLDLRDIIGWMRSHCIGIGEYASKHPEETGLKEDSKVPH